MTLSPPFFTGKMSRGGAGDSYDIDVIYLKNVTKYHNFDWPSVGIVLVFWCEI